MPQAERRRLLWLTGGSPPGFQDGGPVLPVGCRPGLVLNPGGQVVNPSRQVPNLDRQVLNPVRRVANSAGQVAKVAGQVVKSERQVSTSFGQVANLARQVVKVSGQVVKSVAVRTNRPDIATDRWMIATRAGLFPADLPPIPTN
jgi:hypothetical protein